MAPIDRLMVAGGTKGCVAVLKSGQFHHSGHALRPTVIVTFYVTSIIKVIYRMHVCWVEIFPEYLARDIKSAFSNLPGCSHRPDVDR